MSGALLSVADYDAVKSMALYGLILLAVLMLGGWGVLALRRRLWSAPRSDADSEMGMASLEDLRRRGLISDEEFRRIRLKAMEKTGIVRPQAKKMSDAASKINELTPDQDLTDFNIGSEGDDPPREDK